MKNIVMILMGVMLVLAITTIAVQNFSAKDDSAAADETVATADTRPDSAHRWGNGNGRGRRGGPGDEMMRRGGNGNVDSPRRGGEERRGGGNPRGWMERENFNKMMKQMETDSPIEYARLNDMRMGDPENFRKAMRELQNKHRALMDAQRKKEIKEIQELRNRAIAGDETAKKELHDKLAQGYMARVKDAEKRIAELEREIAEQRKKLKELNTKRENNIKKILDYILSDQKKGEIPPPPRDQNPPPPPPDTE